MLAFVNFTTILDFMVMMPLGQQLQDFFNLNPDQWGIVVASYTITGAITGFSSAFFLDRFDRKSLLLALYCGFTLGTFWCGIADSYEMLVTARAFTGAFGGIIGAVVLSIVGDLIPLERRASAIGIVSAGFSAAAALGVPTGLYMGSLWSWRAPFFAIGFTAIPVFLLLLRYIPKMDAHMGRPLSFVQNLKVIGSFFKDVNQRNALVFFCLLIFSHFTIIPFVAPYMQLNVGFEEMELVYIYFSGGLVTLFTAPIVGRISDRWGKQRVFITMLILSCIPLYLITNLGPSEILIPLIITTFFFITINGRLVPAQTLAMSTAHPKERGTFMSVKTSVQYLGSAIASLVAGYVVEKNVSTGQYEHYDTLGWIAVGGSLLTLFLIGRFVAKH